MTLLTAVDLASDDPERFKLARDVDHLMCLFQYDDCHFQNLKKRAPGASDTDGVLLLCIRRANLDALWARKPGTVHSNRREGAVIELSKQLGLENPYPGRGPYPVKDSFGMGVAAMMLMRSLGTGKNAKTIQYKTMRKLRGHYSKILFTRLRTVSVPRLRQVKARVRSFRTVRRTVIGSNGSCTVATSAWVTCGFRIARSPWKSFCVFNPCWKKTGDSAG